MKKVFGYIVDPLGANGFSQTVYVDELNYYIAVVDIYSYTIIDFYILETDLSIFEARTANEFKKIGDQQYFYFVLNDEYFEGEFLLISVYLGKLLFEVSLSLSLRLTIAKFLLFKPAVSSFQKLILQNNKHRNLDYSYYFKQKEVQILGKEATTFIAKMITNFESLINNSPIRLTHIFIIEGEFILFSDFKCEIKTFSKLNHRFRRVLNLFFYELDPKSQQRLLLGNSQIFDILFAMKEEVLDDIDVLQKIERDIKSTYELEMQQYVYDEKEETNITKDDKLFILRLKEKKKTIQFEYSNDEC